VTNGKNSRLKPVSQEVSIRVHLPLHYSWVHYHYPDKSSNKLLPIPELLSIGWLLTIQREIKVVSKYTTDRQKPNI